MSDSPREHAEIEAALGRLAERDRDSAPNELLQRLSERPYEQRRSVLARIGPWALAAAAVLAVVAVPLLAPSGGDGVDESAALEAAFNESLDASWLLGNELAGVERVLDEVSRTLDESEIEPFRLELTGDL